MLRSLAQRPIPCVWPARHRLTRACRPSMSRLRRAGPIWCATCSTKGRMPILSTITATSPSISLASALLRAEAARRGMELPQPPAAAPRLAETPQQGRQMWPRSAHFFGTQFPANSLSNRSSRRARSLEDELPAHLADAPGHGACCRAKLAAGDVADNPGEIGVVKNVEKLSPEYDGHSFVDGDALRCSEIGVDNARPVKEADRGVAQLPYRLGGKRTRQEVGVRSVRAGVAWILSHHRAGYKRNINADSRQGVIVTLAESNWKAGREPADSADGPTLGQALRPGAQRAVERNLPGVAGNEIVRKIEW